MSHLDPELKPVAEDWAEKMYTDMARAQSDVSAKLEGEGLRIYNELKEWGWFELHPVGDDATETATRIHLATIKYGKLKWQKDHPPKEKKSKWEIVTGHKMKR
tara:strand:- start:3625 stop:3933 length:309 start_codon:yes stop_codon:yes gene_type:complete